MGGKVVICEREERVSAQWVSESEGGKEDTRIYPKRNESNATHLD